MVLFSVYFIKQRKRKNFKFFCFLKKIFFPFFLNLFFFLPLFLNLGQKNVSNRFFETSIFSDIQIIEFSNDNRVLKNNSLFSRFFYHRYWLFGKEILENFVSHFNFNFLFVSGDTNARHSTQHFGLFYLTDIILFFVGLIYLVKIKNKRWELIIFFAFWLIIGILPSSISYGSPHALRILSVAPIFFLVLLLGVMFLFNQINSIKNIKFKIFLIATFGVFYFAGVVDFCNYYFNIYPKKYSQDWQYGYHDLMIFLNQYQDKISQIYVTREYGRPAMAYFFYNKINPLLVQQSTNKVKKDQSEILEFQNISFINSFNEVDFNKKNILVAGTISECRRLEELAINKTKKLLQEIKDLNQQVIWQVWQINY